MHAIAGASIILSKSVFVQPAVIMQLRKAAIGQHTSKVVCSAAAGVVKGRDANATKGSIEAVKVPVGTMTGIAWKARKAVCCRCERHCLDIMRGSTWEW